MAWQRKGMDRLVVLVVVTVVCVLMESISGLDPLPPFQARWNINGWYPCSLPTLKDNSSFSVHNSLNASAGVAIQCATVALPLCHTSSLCSSSSNETVNVFVKRILANNIAVEREVPTSSSAALYMLQGGPGLSSIALEPAMEMMYKLLNGTVDVYTVDHRGVGRSDKLECPSAQAEVPGSVAGSKISISELPACMQDISYQLRNRTAAFSVTSAALDLVELFQEFNQNQDIFVYGVSYGAYLTERVMQMNPPQVKGYVLDGVVSRSKKNRQTFTTWDKDFSDVAVGFLELCESDAECSAQFESKNLTSLVWDLYNKLDSEVDWNPCSNALSMDGSPPSFFLKIIFSTFLKDQNVRAGIFALVFRAERCNSEDVKVLANVVQIMKKMSEQSSNFIPFRSSMLYNIIVFSELWQTPTPSMNDLEEWYNSSIFASGSHNMLRVFCMLSGSFEKGCKDLNSNSIPSILYARDQYWDAPSTVPSHASALLMTGGLDPQTPAKYAREQYRYMEGERRHIEFPHSAHGTLFNTPLESNPNITCAALILQSYVQQNGNLQSLNVSCRNHVMPLSLMLPPRISMKLFGVSNMYDDAEGKLLWVVLGTVLLAVSLLFVYKRTSSYRKTRRHREHVLQMNNPISSPPSESV